MTTPSTMMNMGTDIHPTCKGHGLIRQIIEEAAFTPEFMAADAARA
eukprot:SAG22_NODE_17559_length_302_cov_2.275862_1_plen_45_part_10